MTTIGPHPDTTRWFPPGAGATRLLLLRHGSTVHSHEGRFSGRNDLPLDPTGRAQAEALAAQVAARYPVEGIISSPLRRARETAQILADRVGVAVVVHDDLIETDFGAWEGLTRAEAEQRSPSLFATWLVSATTAPPHGESFAQVEERARRAVADIVADHHRRCVAVVSHVTPIKTLLRLALAAPQETMFRFHLDTASLSVVDHYDDGTTSVRGINMVDQSPGS